MKEIEENGIIYIVSDNYPKPPYVKHIKNKGTPEEKPSIDVSKLTDLDFRKLLLEKVGIKVKE